MSAGRRPKPVELKLLEGNPGGRKLPTVDERPDVKHGKPVAPPNLPKEAAILWRELVKLLDNMGVLANSDRRALEMLCRAYATYLKANDEIESRGLLLESLNAQTGLSMMKRNPAVDIANAAHANMVRLLIEFGLTPAARGKVSKEGPKKDPLGDYLGKPRGPGAA